MLEYVALMGYYRKSTMRSTSNIIKRFQVIKFHITSKGSKEEVDKQLSNVNNGQEKSYLQPLAGCDPSHDHNADKVQVGIEHGHSQHWKLDITTLQLPLVLEAELDIGP